MEISGNRQLVDRLFDEVWNQKKLAVIDEIFAPDFRFHAGSTVLDGRESVRQALAAWQQGFPDIRHTVDDVIDAGDRVVVRWHGEGTHLGIFSRLAPSGRRMDYSGITIFNVRQGQFSECWVSADLKRLFDCIQVYSDKRYTEQDFAVDFNGPAQKIDRILMARGTTPSTRQTIVNALRNLFAYLPPPDAPQLAMPAELFERVDFRRMQTPGPRGPISCYVYHPKESAADPPPVLIYFHGGGWSIGDPAEADLLTRRIALESGAVVVSVDYRLAPEHPYPAGLDDAMAVYRWVRQNAATELGADPARVAVGGDSSGGNLSAAMVLRARDEGLARPDAALLLCPLTDFDCEKYGSYQRLAPRGLLYDAAFLGFVRSCLCGATDWRIPYLSPMNGDLAGYCPTCIIAAGEDPLWDENHVFADKLRAAGNPDVELLEYPKMPHAFYYFLGLADDVDRVQHAMGAFLRQTLTGSRT